MSLGGLCLFVVLKVWQMKTVLSLTVGTEISRERPTSDTWLGWCDFNCLSQTSIYKNLHNITWKLFSCYAARNKMKVTKCQASIKIHPTNLSKHWMQLRRPFAGLTHSKAIIWQTHQRAPDHASLWYWFQLFPSFFLSSLLLLLTACFFSDTYPAQRHCIYHQTIASTAMQIQRSFCDPSGLR